ncbi:MAG: hypothetical protein ACW98F_04250 [Candidatus Hodarchaeales archaeon]|jgi:tetratricopeptide (TPR) repeat protein
MFPFITEQTEDIGLLISQGNIEEALNQVNDLLPSLDKANSHYTSLFFLKIYLLLLNNSAEEAKHLTDKLYISVTKSKDPSLISDVLVLKAETLRALGNFSGSEALRHPTVYMEILPESLPEYTRIINTYEEQMRSLEDKNSIATNLKLAWLLSSKGIIFIAQSNLEQALIVLKRSLKLFKKLKNVEGEARVLKIIGSLHGVM